MTLAMSGLPWEHPARSLLGCCGRPVIGEEVTAFRGRQIPVAPAFERGPLSVRSSGFEGADWTPRAVSGHGALDLDLMMDTPMTARLSAIPSRQPDPGAKAIERSRIFNLVSGFAREATLGRRCSLLELDNFGRSVGACREARYELQNKAETLVLYTKASDGWRHFGSWPLRATLGAHRAEDSALVQNARHDLSNHFSEEELGRAAVLELRGSGSSRAPQLLVEASVEHRDRLVVALRVLRLYWASASQ